MKKDEKSIFYLTNARIFDANDWNTLIDIKFVFEIDLILVCFTTRISNERLNFHKFSWSILFFVRLISINVISTVDEMWWWKSSKNDFERVVYNFWMLSSSSNVRWLKHFNDYFQFIKFWWNWSRIYVILLLCFDSFRSTRISKFILMTKRCIQSRQNECNKFSIFRYDVKVREDESKAIELWKICVTKNAKEWKKHDKCVRYFCEK